LSCFLKEGREFELQRESGSRFHSFGAEAWNAQEPTVLHHGSAKRLVLDDRRQQQGMLEVSSSE